MIDSAPSNQKLVVILIGMAVLMFGVAFASVPLYNLFCKVTGFGGTPQIAEAEAMHTIVDREITVRFNTDVSPKLPWKFQIPEEKKVKMRIGEPILVAFSAENISDQPITGTSTYNVTPFKAAEYFVKQQCFCFERQTIAPGQKVFFPVSFFIDPSIVDDNNLDEVKTITLSYTFFKAEDVAN